MLIKVEIDTTLALKVAQNVLRQLPYAMNNAVTKTAQAAVAVGREEVQTHFTLRKNFVKSRVRVLTYSRVGNLTATIGIDPYVQGSPLLLGFFEEGESGSKEPMHGSGIAIPATGGPARPSFEEPVLTSFRYTNLRIVERRGRKQTFVIPGVGVFERIGSGGRVWDKSAKRMVTEDTNETQIVYLFRPAAPLRSRMELRAKMAAEIRRAFPTIFSEEFEKEIMRRTARLK
jgi:hypothetical protein